MHRRDFLRGFAALAALPVADGVQGLPLPSPGRRLGALGIQLYTLREMAARDLDATLAAVAGAGYREIELLGFTRNYGHEPAEVRAMLDRHGLIAPATHVTAGHVAAGLERHLERAAVMGH